MKENIENENVSFSKDNILDNEGDKKENLIDYKTIYSSYNINNNLLLEEIITSDVKKKDEDSEKKPNFKLNQKEGEKIALLSEKEGLKRILRDIQMDLNLDEDTLEETYEPFLNNEDMTKKTIKNETDRCSLIFMFYIVSPLFGVINLVGVFESLLMMKILFQVFQNSTIQLYYSLVKEEEEIEKFSIYDFNMKYNYYYMFFDDAKKDSFDFNLMMFTAFLGDILLQSRGFRVSTFVFSLINAGSFFLILSFSFFDYELDYNTYSIFRILYLLLGYILLLIGAGASALLSQQIIIDSNHKYNDYVKKLNEKTHQFMKVITKQKEEEREKEEKNKLPTLNDILTIKKEEENKEDEIEKNLLKKDEEEIKFPLKSAKSQEIKINPKIEIIGDERKEIDNEEEKNLNVNKIYKQKDSFKNIKTDIEKVDSRKSMLGRAKTMLVTKNDENNSRRFTYIKRKESRKKEKELAKANIKKKNKFDSFFMICITTIIGYFIKYLINIIIAEKNLNIDNYIYLTNCGNDTNCFQNLIKDNNLSNSDINLFKEVIEKINYDGKKSFILIIIIYAACIASSILLYSFFVCIFEKKKKKDDDKNIKNKYRVCEICGYVIYSQNIILIPNPPICQCCKLFCKTFQKCLNMACCSIIHCICCFSGYLDEDNENKDREKTDKDDNEDKSDNKNNNEEKTDIKNEKEEKEKREKEEREFIKKLKDDYENPECCNCCCQYKKSDYVKNQQFFCYCYQAQRKSYWFNIFLTNDTQRKLFPYMVEYFILQILICAFEQQYFLQSEKNDHSNKNSNQTNHYINTNLFNLGLFNNKTDNYTNNSDNNNYLINDLYSFLTFILTFFLFFYLTISFYRFSKIPSEKEDEKKIGGLDIFKNLSLGILGGTHSVLLFDGLFSLIFSSLYLSDNGNEIFENDNLYLIPILMNKFYYFTLIFYCISYSEEKRKFELISSSTLISVYIFIINLIISLIKSYISLRGLYIIQMVFTCCFPCLFILIMIILFFYILYSSTCVGRISCIFGISSFFCCLGGFWITFDILKGLEANISGENVDCSGDCFCECCFCWIDCFYYFISMSCCKSICPDILCKCCNCCICYDCCNCCECCYCCGDECSCEFF